MKIPEERLLISEKQRKLEIQGCKFTGQERLDNHQIDENLPCYCGRPNKQIEEVK